MNDPAPLRYDAWIKPDTTSFSVRGPTYLHDSRKIASDPGVFQLLTTDLIFCPEGPLMGGICGHPTNRIDNCDSISFVFIFDYFD